MSNRTLEVRFDNQTVRNITNKNILKHEIIF